MSAFRWMGAKDWIAPAHGPAPIFDALFDQLLVRDLLAQHVKQGRPVHRRMIDFVIEKDAAVEELSRTRDTEPVARDGLA